MELDPKRFYRFLAPRPTVIVTTVDKEKNINAAPFSFVMPVSMDPPLIAIALGHKKDTLRNIKETREFVVNVPPEEILNKLWICSKSYPRGANELKEAGLTEVPSEKVLAPLIGECIAWFECLVEHEKELGDHVLIIGRVINAIVKDEIVGEDGDIDLKKARTLMHLGGSKFAVAERKIIAKEENEE